MLDFRADEPLGAGAANGSEGAGAANGSKGAGDANGSKGAGDAGATPRGDQLYLSSPLPLLPGRGAGVSD